MEQPAHFGPSPLVGRQEQAAEALLTAEESDPAHVAGDHRPVLLGPVDRELEPQRGGTRVARGLGKGPQDDEGSVLGDVPQSRRDRLALGPAAKVNPDVLGAGDARIVAGEQEGVKGGFADNLLKDERGARVTGEADPGQESRSTAPAPKPSGTPLELVTRLLADSSLWAETYDESSKNVQRANLHAAVTAAD